MLKAVSKLAACQKPRKTNKDLGEHLHHHGPDVHDRFETETLLLTTGLDTNQEQGPASSGILLMKKLSNLSAPPTNHNSEHGSQGIQKNHARACHGHAVQNSCASPQKHCIARCNRSQSAWIAALSKTYTSILELDHRKARRAGCPSAGTCQACLPSGNLVPHLLDKGCSLFRQLHFQAAP